MAKSFSMESLNAAQRKAVQTLQGPVLILAGAGTGKTRTVTCRIAHMVDRGISPKSILAVTFTNKAALEMRERVGQMVERKAARQIMVSTFHSLCVRILREDIGRLGYKTNFTIYSGSEQSGLIRRLIVRHGGITEKITPKDVLSSMSRMKNSGLGLDSIEDNLTANIAASYQRELQAQNSVDFDDLLILADKLLKEHRDVREAWQQRFRYITVDEFQDTNSLQMSLLGHLVGPEHNVCVVGDDDQSIYKFRGATIENILSFEKQFKGARVIRLEQNYRSTQAILNAANAVISHNRGRKGKKLWTQNAAGDRITVYEASSESDEANYIASRIISMSKGKNFKDFAVLYRTNAQSNAVENAFKRSGIPYRIIGGTRFFDRAEVKDMLAYLCVINNRADELRLQRIINNPPRGIGGKTLEMAQRQAAAAGVPLYTVVSDPYSYPSLEKSAAKLMAFTVVIEECAELLTTLSLPDFYEEVMLRTGYLNMLEEKDDIEARTRAENIRELKSSILAYMENTDTPTLAGFLEEIALYTDIEQYDPDADAVVMMTMHAAKGLEFPNVFLTGFEEGLFPSNRCLSEPEELEEERRLCYVAITRAKQNLVISYARQRMLYGRTTTNLPSRFVDELPAESVKRVGAPKPSYSQQAPRQYGSFGRVSIYGDEYNDFSQIPTRPKPQKDYSVHTQPKPAPKVSFAAGEMVQHKAFGRGMILTVLPMGADALLEIAFDGVGTKRLMANTAAQHMKKL